VEFLMRILALGAHYDDIEMGLTGTLKKHADANDEIIIAVTSADEHRTGDINARHQEQLSVLNALKIPRRNLWVFYGRLDFDIIGILDTVKPDLIYTQYERDSHQAHVRCSQIGQSIGRKPNVQVMFYNSGSAYDFMPSIFSIIDFKYKLQILNTFKSQIESCSINFDMLNAREQYWGSLVSDDTETMAEGFIPKKLLYDIIR